MAAAGGTEFEGDGVHGGIESRGMAGTGLRGDHAGLPDTGWGTPHRLAQIGTLSVLHVRHQVKNRMTRAPSRCNEHDALEGLLNAILLSVSFPNGEERTRDHIACSVSGDQGERY